MARICEVFLLLRPKFGGQMRLIAFDTEGAQIESDWHMAAQPAPDYEVVQRVNG